MKREYKYETLYKRALEREEGINIIGCPAEDIRLIKKNLIENFPEDAGEIIKQLDSKGKIPPYLIKYPTYEQTAADGYLRGFFVGKVTYRKSVKEYFFNQYAELEELYNNLQRTPNRERHVYTCFRLIKVVSRKDGKTFGENLVEEFGPLEMTMKRLFGH